jgi:hypothetical protein
MKTDSAELYSITNLAELAGQHTREDSHSHGERAGRRRAAGVRGVEED